MSDRCRKEASYGYAIWIQRLIQFKRRIGTCPNIEVGIDVTDKSPFSLGCITLRKI